MYFSVRGGGREIWGGKECWELCTSRNHTAGGAAVTQSNTVVLLSSLEHVFHMIVCEGVNHPPQCEQGYSIPD